MIMGALPTDDVLLKELRRMKLERTHRKQIVLPKDGYQWLKYGQKDLARTKLRRCYFKCSHHEDHNCVAKLQISYKKDEPKVLTVKYEGKHNHSRGYSPVQSPRRGERRSASGSQQTFSMSCSHSTSQERQQALQCESLAAPFQCNVPSVSCTSIGDGDSLPNEDLMPTEKTNPGIGKWSLALTCEILEQGLSGSNTSLSSTRPPSSTYLGRDLNSSMASQDFQRTFKVEKIMDGTTASEKLGMERTANKDRLPKEGGSLLPFPSNKPTSSFISTPIGKFLTFLS